MIATVRHFGVSEREIQTWLLKEKRIESEVKRLNSLLIWIRPLALGDFMPQLGSFPFAPLFHRIDRWTEVLGPGLKTHLDKIGRYPFACLGCCGFPVTGRMAWDGLRIK